MPPNHHDVHSTDVLGAWAQGLGYPALSQMKVSPPFFTMLQEGTLPQSLFSIWLNPNPQQLEAGDITFGGIDKSRYRGSIAYLPSVSNTYACHLAIVTPANI